MLCHYTQNPGNYFYGLYSLYIDCVLDETHCKNSTAVKIIRKKSIYIYDEIFVRVVNCFHQDIETIMTNAVLISMVFRLLCGVVALWNSKTQSELFDAADQRCDGTKNLWKIFSLGYFQRRDKLFVSNVLFTFAIILVSKSVSTQYLYMGI